MDQAILTGLAASTVTMAVPLLLAALGELIAERSGTINIGLEGMLLMGAFTALIAAYFSGSSALGIGLAVGAGALFGLLMAYFVVGANANQVVAGAALNLLALGLTGVAYRAVFGVTGSAITVRGAPAFSVPVLRSLPVFGAAVFQQTLLGYASFVLVPLLAFALAGTLPGLALRMVGENPRAAEAQGVHVKRVRTLALVACGALAAAGGAFLSVVYANTFVEGMSAGRGFIALAVVIVGRWSAWGILLAALFFGLASSLQFQFQALGVAVPYQLFLMLPYVLTLVVLAGYAGRARPPAALGQGYRRD